MPTFIASIRPDAKNIVSLVAGRADILLVPDLDSGNMLAKQFEYLAGAHIAGIVLGARVPIVLTSRADKAPARLVSCAIARLLARNNAESELLGGRTAQRMEFLKQRHPRGG